MFAFHPNHMKFCHGQFIYLVSLTAHNLRLGSIFALLGKSNCCAQVEMKRSYCAFHIHGNSKFKKLLSQLRFLLLSIIITITSNEP